MVYIIVKTQICNIMVLDFWISPRINEIVVNISLYIYMFACIFLSICWHVNKTQWLINIVQKSMTSNTLYGQLYLSKHINVSNMHTPPQTLPVQLQLKEANLIIFQDDQLSATYLKQMSGIRDDCMASKMLFIPTLVQLQTT